MNLEFDFEMDKKLRMDSEQESPLVTVVVGQVPSKLEVVTHSTQLERSTVCLSSHLHIQ
jgi:hypothetical protein